MNIFIDAVKPFGYNEAYLRKGRDCQSDFFFLVYFHEQIWNILQRKTKRQ